ncbi:MAG: HU family DNA-binding protein [Clostridia bacterium]|nr:HU family DNA-binding protein [Clostridia bacterium]
MNKSEFIRAYADKLGITIKDADASVNAFIATLTDSLQKGEYVHISGFATFELKDKAARDGVNPLTGAKVKIKACKAPAAKFSKAYKDIFNK